MALLDLDGMEQPAPARLTASVLGPPQFYGNKRAFVSKKTGRAFVAEQKSASVKSWQETMRAACQECAPPSPFNGPASVSIMVYFRRPASHFGTGRNAERLKDNAPTRAAVKPDIDKIARAVLDCLTGIWLTDDARVTTLHVLKHYAGPGYPARTIVSCEFEDD